MNADALKVKQVLEKILGIISVDDISIQDRIIKTISLKKESVGELIIQRIRTTDAAALFDFYFWGLSTQSRIYFPPYPLFSPPMASVPELTQRIKDWSIEDDWTVLKLVKDEKIIGVGLLKRYKTGKPTSGLAVIEELQGKGVGFLIQTIINEQARLLELKELYATVAQTNTASLELHQRCGFKQTGDLVPHFVYRNGVKEIDRQDIGMVIKFSDDQIET